MTIADDVAVTAAESIVEIEFRRVNRRRAAGCCAIAAMFVLATALLTVGFASRSPSAFVAGVGCFVVGLGVSSRVDGPPML